MISFLLFLLVSDVAPVGDVRDRAFWLAIAEQKYAVPAGETPADLLAEMNDLVGSTDPALRDEVAYGAAVRWMYRQRLLTPEQVKSIVRMWTANLSAGLGEDGTDTVFRRSFSALNLSVAAALDNEAPFLTPAEHELLLSAALDYLARERDTRGYDRTKGWIHTPAHTADLLKFLARSPKLPADGQRRLLAAVSDKCAAVGHAFVWGEDERLAEVVRSIVRRPDLDVTGFEAWVAQFPAAHQTLWAKAPAIDPDAFPAVQNVKALLRAAFAALSADEDLSPAAVGVRQQILRALAKMR